MKRQRATIIVEVDQRILLVENRGGLVLLPGGGINPEESRLQAAVRELAEETGLIAESMLFLFSHESATNCHNVFWAAASGAALAGDDATALHFFEQDSPLLFGKMSRASRQIIDRFLAMRGETAAALAFAAPSVPGAVDQSSSGAEAWPGAYI
jgi:8-oxo-dGTP diphosphatase